MPKSNLETYKKIVNELANNPDARITELCARHKVPYQSYQSWFRRNASQVEAIVKGGQPKTAVKQSSAKLTKQEERAENQTLLALSLSELARTVAAGEKEIVFNVDEVVSKLPENEQGAFLSLVTKAIRDRK